MSEDEALRLSPQIWDIHEGCVCVDRSTLGSATEGWEVTTYYVHPSKLIEVAAKEIQRLRGTLSGISGIPSSLWNEGTTAQLVRAAEEALNDYDQ